MAVISSLSTVIELLWRRGVAVCAVCYTDGHIGLLIEGGVVRWLPFNHVAQPSAAVAETLAREIAETVLRREIEA